MFKAISEAAQLVGKLYKLKDRIEILEAIGPLQEKLNQAQVEATNALSDIHALTVRNHELESQIRELSFKDPIKKGYSIHKLLYGAIVLKADEEGDYPFICADCAENDKKSPLHEVGSYLHCNACNGAFRLRDNDVLSVRQVSRSRSDLDQYI